MLALWIADGPIVATFHTALIRSRPLQIAYPLVRQSLEKISARIAVSEDARRTLVEHLGGDAVVIPNGVYVDAFAAARAGPALDRHAGARRRSRSSGRLDEPRKGLPVLLGGVPQRARRSSRVRGSSSPAAARPARRGPRAAGRPGAAPSSSSAAISDEDKARLLRVRRRLLRAADRRRELRHRPRRGDERRRHRRRQRPRARSRRVLDDGAAGVLFRTGDCRDLARDARPRAATTRSCGPRVAAHALDGRCGSYDWSAVTDQVLAVYEMVVAGPRRARRRGPVVAARRAPARAAPRPG